MISSNVPLLEVEKNQKNDLAKRICATALLVALATVLAYDGLAIDGILPLIQQHFGIQDSLTGLMKTCSSAASTLALAFMWIFGDRFVRKSLLIFSIVGFSAVNLLALLSTPTMYWFFVLCRTAAGGFSSIFTVILPVIIGDLFKDKALGRALMCNAFAGMIGGILSASVSSVFLTSGLSWRAGLLPGLVITALLIPGLLVLVPKNSTPNKIKRLNNLSDALSLISIKSYTLMVIAMALGAFYLKSNLFWMPTFLLSAWTLHPEVYLNLPYAGVITTKSMAELTGTMIGLPLLVFVAESWHFGSGLCKSRRGYGRAIPIMVLASAALAATAALGQIFFSDKSYAALVASAFMNSVMGAPTMSLGIQLLLGVCPLNKRTSALSLVYLISGVITLPSEQIIGGISDFVRGDSESPQVKYDAYKVALFFNWCTFALAAVVYSSVVYFYKKDHEKVALEDAVEDEDSQILAKSRANTIAVDYNTFLQVEQSLENQEAMVGLHH